MEPDNRRKAVKSYYELAYNMWKLSIFSLLVEVPLTVSKTYCYCYLFIDNIGDSDMLKVIIAL